MWKRFVAPTVIVTSILLLVSGCLTAYIYWLERSYQRVLVWNVTSIQADAELRTVIWRTQAHLAKNEKLTSGHLNDLQAEAEVAARALREAANLPGEEELAASVTNQIRRYFGLVASFSPVEQSTGGQAASATPTGGSADRRTSGTPRSNGAQAASAAPSGAQVGGGTLRSTGGQAASATRVAQIAGATALLAGDSTALQRELEATAKLIVQKSHQIRKMNQRAIGDSTARWEYGTGMLILIQTVLIVVGPSVGIVLGLLTAKRLRDSVSRIDITLSDAVNPPRNQFAQVEWKPEDDLSRINDQVNHVVQRIRHVTAELNDSRLAALRSERLAAVGSLAASVAHEIRNPLTSVKLLLQHAGRETTRRLTAQQLDVVLHEITRIEATIQGLLDFSRPPQMHRRRHDLRDTLRRALHLVEVKARQGKVRLTASFEGSPLPVDADSEQIHQVLVNLLINGIEATPADGTVELRARAAPDEPASIRVEILDTGHGIPPEILGRLFEPFVSTKDRGTGLGLAVCHRVATEHAGTLTAENRPGGGAAFIFTLPMASPAEAVAERDLAGVAAAN